MFIYSGSQDMKTISPIPFLVIYVYPIVILQNYLPLFFPLSFLTTSGLYPSPKQIPSVFSSWLLTLPAKKQPPKEHKTSALLARNAEHFSSIVLASAKTHSSVTSNNTKRQGCLEPSATQSEQHCIVRKFTKSWLQAQSEGPWTTWHRPSEIMMNPIPSSSGPVTLQAFFFGSLKDT